jgi:hypothetical protein
MQIFIFLLVLYFAFAFGFSVFQHAVLLAIANWPLILLVCAVVAVAAGGIAYAKGRSVPEAVLQGFFFPVVLILKLSLWFARAVFGVTTSVGKPIGK